MSTLPTEVALLRELVQTPSVSGSEEEVARLAETTARSWGLDVIRDETGVKLEITGRRPGRTLALVSHLDVVPPGEGWTRDPFSGDIEQGRLYGRGSGDAKASVAAMLFAAKNIVAGNRLASGRLLVILGYGEETRNTSMPHAVASVGTIDAAVIGEPTSLDFAVAQRGLMMVDLIARGSQRHAAYAQEDGTFTNSIERLALDLTRLSALCQERPHPVLGHPTITATMLAGGISRNVTPPSATAVLDVRSTPAWTHEELASALRASLASDVVVTSDRLVPCQTPVGSTLLPLASRARPGARQYGSPTCSDWVFLRHCDAFKCGPGTSRLSHTPDESVAVSEVVDATRFYAELAAGYLE